MRSLVLAAALLSSPLAFADTSSFVFLPPMVATQPDTVGRLDASAQPTVTVEDLTPPDKGSGDVPYYVVLSGSDVKVEGNHFSAKWQVPSVASTHVLRFTVYLDKQNQIGTMDAPAAQFPANQTYPVKFFFNGCVEVTCPGANQCHVASVCDPNTFQCSQPPILCGAAEDSCHTSSCDEARGLCVHPGLSGEYPVGPYGQSIGDTIANLTFDGVYASNNTVEQPISLSHFWQDGLAEVLVMSECATWCGPCQAQRAYLKSIAPSYNGQLAVFDLLAQNQVGLPPTYSNLRSWGGGVFDVGADPTEILWSYGSPEQAFPYTVVVRVRDMKIMWTGLGYDQAALQSAIDSVLAGPSSAPVCAPL
jgi:hypothetical protein